MGDFLGLENEIKAVLRKFGDLAHWEVQGVLGRISSAIHAGTVVLDRVTGFAKDHSVAEALKAAANRK